MNDMSKAGNSETLVCPQRKDWISFRLVDEHGNGTPYARLGYTLHDNQGQQYPGVLDQDGFACIEGIYCGPAVLDFKPGRWQSRPMAPKVNSPGLFQNTAYKLADRC